MLSLKYVLALTSWLLLCLLLGASGIMLLVIPVIAQDTEIESKKERRIRGGMGTYFSLIRTTYNTTGSSVIENPEDDIMPFPAILFSIRYKKNIEALIGWRSDNKNEDIFKFALRYNKYGNKHIYIFGGPVLWNFNKSYNFAKIECTEYSANNHPFSSRSCKEESEREVEIKTDRPDGSSITLGIISGIGIKYKLGFLAFSHEMELFFSPCQYRDFICFGGDLKFLGVHFEL